jgi:hypothetical protein
VQQNQGDEEDTGRMGHGMMRQCMRQCMAEDGMTVVSMRMSFAMGISL